MGEVAAQHERAIDPEHFGVLIPYTMGDVPEPILAGLRNRRPDLADPTELVPVGWDTMIAQIRRFIDVGASKFVVIPLSEPGGARRWIEHLGEAATALLPLQN